MCVCGRLFLCLSVCLSVRLSVCLCVCVCVHDMLTLCDQEQLPEGRLRDGHVQAGGHPAAGARVHLGLEVCMCMYACVYVCMYACGYVCMYVYARTCPGAEYERC